MNHFDEILREGQSLIHHNFHQNEQLYDKSTNQSNLMATANQAIPSPFDSSPKASMFFFSLSSPRQNADNFQFNHQNSLYTKNCKDHIQPISRRLEFQEDASLFCQEQEQDQEDLSVKEEEPWNYESSDSPPKGKKIKKSKNSKGLKNLSIGVYDIVAQKSQTTYKEVANALIEKLSKKAKEQMNTDQGYKTFKKLQKDEHNIKRRVYDALNVLISAQLLRKQGKRVICNYYLKQQNSNKQFLQQQRQKVSSQLSIKQSLLEQKKQQFYTLQNKYRKLHSLFSKNKLLGPKPANSINLPFIVAKSNTDDIGDIDIREKGVLIGFRGNILIMGDIDTIEDIQYN